jgi:hypothetical protein
MARGTRLLGGKQHALQAGCGKYFQTGHFLGLKGVGSAAMWKLSIPRNEVIAALVAFEWGDRGAGLTHLYVQNLPDIYRAFVSQ